MEHPDHSHPRRHRRLFSRFAVWFSDWQGSPPFVALLTCFWIAWLVLNKLAFPTLGVRAFDPNTWYLNLLLSLLAAYAASLAVMGTKVLFDRLFERLARIERVLESLAHSAPEPLGVTTSDDDGVW